jgi:hypothetical protein
MKIALITCRIVAGNTYGSLFRAIRSLKRTKVKPYLSIFVEDRGPGSLRIHDPRNTTRLWAEYLTTIISFRIPAMLIPALRPSLHQIYWRCRNLASRTQFPLLQAPPCNGFHTPTFVGKSQLPSMVNLKGVVIQCRCYVGHWQVPTGRCIGATNPQSLVGHARGDSGIDIVLFVEVLFQQRPFGRLPFPDPTARTLPGTA